MRLENDIAAAISRATGERFAPRASRAIGGGSINRTFALEDGARRFFVKVNDASRLDMFEAEADGLAALDAAGALRVPRRVACGTSAGAAFLVLEFLDLGGPADFARLGEQLVQLHRSIGPHFGWQRDNFIGATPQPNAKGDDWPRFFAGRLRFQLELARGNGHRGGWLEEGLRLCQELRGFFDERCVQPSLLHGDLWAGNTAFLCDGTPVVFDPAVYRGDREADLAMTELFGGFPPAFYAAYRDAWPLEDGYPVRRTLYNLYHVLNHLNLFGGGYLGQAQRMVRTLRAELGTA